VKEIFITSGWLTRAAPVSPKPVTIFTTPGGNPASTTNSANLKIDKGVYSAGFKTTVFPQQSEGANFQTAISIGKFHGTISPQTPIGSLRV